MTKRRLAALAALILAAIAVVLATVGAATAFPRGVWLAGCLVAAVGAAVAGVFRRGAARVVGLAIAAIALTAALVFVFDTVRLIDVLAVAAVIAAAACARIATAVHVSLPPATAPQNAVLFFNPLSGGGKAQRFSLPAEARARGIEPIELHPGDELEALVREAVAGGADGLAMAGGDGSQAIVAAVAAERRLPYACIPAGTRNHFALDLGVDRDDVVGALDAFVDGGERRVDLGEVSGRVFVNNVSLGLYAEAVQSRGYREAKLRTLLDKAPEAIGGETPTARLRWTGPGGSEHRMAAAILVSNNRYRLGRAVGSGTRPRIDDGLLGITVVGPPRGRGTVGRGSQRPWREWSAPSFEVDADEPVPAGIDGEAARLEPPLRFSIHRRVLIVRIARKHPGASPSAFAPNGAREGIGLLASIAAGRDPGAPSRADRSHPES
jgi:diacylglycerol kinase family enzyme